MAVFHLASFIRNEHHIFIVDLHTLLGSLITIRHEKLIFRTEFDGLSMYAVLKYDVLQNPSQVVND